MVGIQPSLALQMALMGDPGLQTLFPEGVEDEFPRIDWGPSAATMSICPSPFRQIAGIEYWIPSSGRCSVKIYDLRGRLVKTLVDGHRDRGYHKVTWMGQDDSGERTVGGVYFVSLKEGEHAVTKKLIRLR